MRSKYRNTKVVIDGIKFDSKREANRFKELSLLEKSGDIKDLTRQVEFVLIPAQYENGKCVERKASYIADFVYYEKGKLIVEDTKGFRTPDYILKRKMMLYIHNIRIREI